MLDTHTNTPLKKKKDTKALFIHQISFQIKSWRSHVIVEDRCHQYCLLPLLSKLLWSHKSPCRSFQYIHAVAPQTTIQSLLGLITYTHLPPAIFIISWCSLEKYKCFSSELVRFWSNERRRRYIKKTKKKERWLSSARCDSGKELCFLSSPNPYIHIQANTCTPNLIKPHKHESVGVSMDHEANWAVLSLTGQRGVERMMRTRLIRQE